MFSLNVTTDPPEPSAVITGHGEPAHFWRAKPFWRQGPCHKDPPPVTASIALQPPLAIAPCHGRKTMICTISLNLRIYTAIHPPKFWACLLYCQSQHPTYGCPRRVDVQPITEQSMHLMLNHNTVYIWGIGNILFCRQIDVIRLYQQSRLHVLERPQDNLKIAGNWISKIRGHGRALSTYPACNKNWGKLMTETLLNYGIVKRLTPKRR